MMHGRGRRAVVAAGVLVLSLGLWSVPASADPGTVPTITAPTDGATVSGPVTVTASSEAPLVQFDVDGTPLGAPVSGTGTAGNPQPVNLEWSTWSFPNGPHSLTAADCDNNAPSCNATLSPSVNVGVDNAQPTMKSPASGTVWGDVALGADAPAGVPAVQFYDGATAIGAPVNVDVAGHASATWSTWSGSVTDGTHTLTAANCDALGCNPTDRSPSVQVTVANVPTITVPSSLSGDVTITATASTPAVQFYRDGVAFGSPVTVVNGSASVTWPTWSLGNSDSFSWSAAGCDLGGPCDPTRSTAVVLQPDNTPPVISPVNGTTVVGNVQISATTAAPKVQFYKDLVPFGPPLAPDSNTHLATVTWSTFGLLNRDYVWSAAECDDYGCNPTTSSATLTLANPLPAITSPASASNVGTLPTITATAPGGGLAFFVDGNRVGFVDGSSPYSLTLTSPLALGNHMTFVKECDGTGTTCQGPVSPTITFNVAKLSPSISSVSPNPFSPNNDGRNDKTSFRVHLPDSEHVSFVVQNANGQTIQGPHTPSGTLGAGDHVFTWNGRNNAGKIAGDGVYTIVVNTSAPSGGSTLVGTATARVDLDNTASALSAITGNQSTIYPVVDGFLDKFRPSVHVNEGGSLWLEIRNARGSRVNLIAQPHASGGTFQLSWSGRDAAGRMLPAGNYHYRFLAQDRAGNRRVSPSLTVHLSLRRTIRHTVAVTRNGDVGRPSATDSYCTQYSLGFSIFEHGLWLDNSCDPGFEGSQSIFADYTMAVPGAVQYVDIRVRTVGETIHAPEPISAFVYDFTHHEWDPVGTVKLGRNARPAMTTFGRVSGLHHVSLRHRVRVRIAVPDKVTPEDYDIKSASIVISYLVLGPP